MGTLSIYKKEIKKQSKNILLMKMDQWEVDTLFMEILYISKIIITYMKKTAFNILSQDTYYDKIHPQRLIMFQIHCFYYK